MAKAKFWVLHDYGTEGWKVMKECGTLLEAVEVREDDLRNGGGRCEILELIPVLEAYRRAAHVKGL